MLSLFRGADYFTRGLCRYYRMISDWQERNMYPVTVERPEGTNVVVISPHPDDDVIACGGTLIKHHEAKCRLTSIYMTDGRKGDPSFGDEDLLVRERQAESRRAGEIVGIDSMIFLANKDQELRPTEATVAELTRLLDEIEPDLVYAPFFVDNHADHRASAAILVESAKRTRRAFACCAYQTWTPMFPNILVDVSREFDRKMAALSEHKTQIRNIDYARICEAAGTLWSLYTDKNVRHAEGFFEAPSREYCELYSRIRGRA